MRKMTQNIAYLRGHSRGLDTTFEDDDHFKVFAKQIPGRHVVEWTLLVNDVHQSTWPNEENVIVTIVKSNFDVGQVMGQDLSFGRHLLLYQLRLNVRLNDMRSSHVTHAEHETQFAVPQRHYSVSTEKQRLCPLFRPGQLGEHHTHHKRLDHDASNRLDAHNEDRFGTFLRGEPGAITNRVLRLDGVQERRGEGVQVVHTRSPLFVSDVFQIAVSETDEPPNDCEAQPTQDESHGEDHQVITPLNIY